MSAASPVAICNRALSLLGSKTIVSFLDGTTEAKMCNIHYAQVRDAVTAEVEWTHATKRFGPMTPEPIAPTFEYSHSYLLPVDLIKLVRATTDDKGRYQLPDYAVEDNRLLCDFGSGVFIKYIARVTDTTKFQQLCTEAMVTRLAAEMCVALTESTSHMERLLKVYDAKIADASAVDNQQGRNVQTTAVRHRRARWTGGAYAPGVDWTGT